MEIVLLKQLAVSLGLGLLLGLERERSGSPIAGIRTFPFISLLGTLTAHAGVRFGGWVVAAGFLALAGILAVANLPRLKEDKSDRGITTEVAILLLYLIGVLIVVGDMTVAVVAVGAMAVLLHAKEPLHKFAAAVGETDMRAMMQFVVLSMIILPVVPRENYGPWGVWNPFKIWLMVVLIVAISLSGYLIYKFFGAKAGTLLGGLIGGLVSSTATTVSFARHTAANASQAPLAAVVIVIASCASLTRVIVEIGAAAPGQFAAIAPPIAALLGVCGLVAGGMFFMARKFHAKVPEQKNPTKLTSALAFGALYAIVLLAVAAAKKYLGSAGLYAVGAVSGMTDMDAITLSSAQMAGNGEISSTMAWQVIMIATMSNLVFKLGTVAVLAPAALTARVAAAFGIIFAAGGLILWLWPSEMTEAVATP